MKSLEFVIPKSNKLWTNYRLTAETSYNYNGWYSGGFYYMIPLYGPKGDVLRPTTSSLYTCREDAAKYYVRSRLKRNEKAAKKFDKTRVIIFLPSTTTILHKDRDIECALKAINVVEKTAGWPLTKVWKLTNDRFNEGIDFYYFEGSRKWIRSPQMLSCYLLFIRAYKGANSDAQKKMSKVKTISALKSFWNRYNGGNDYTRMRAVLCELSKVIKNYSKLFSKRDMVSLYIPDPKSGVWFFYNEGIQRMLKGHSMDYTLREDWNKVKNG